MAAKYRVSRRSFLKATGAAAGAAAIASFPAVLRAQARTIKIGAVHPVTGPLAEVGQSMRLAAQLAVDTLNAAGGIKSMGGARLALVASDSQSKADVAVSETQRVINEGAVAITGPFLSGLAMAMVPIAQQRRVPFLIDVAAADAITLNVAKSVKEGQQKVQYVYRLFPTTALFGRKAVTYMNEIFKATGTSPKRAVLMYANDAFGKPQSESFIKAHKEIGSTFEIVEVIPFPEVPQDLSTEVSRAKAARPDLICPITRPVSAALLIPELAKQRVDVLGVLSPGAPGLYEKPQIDRLGRNLEYTMDVVPWVNPLGATARKVAAEYAKRSGGKALDTNSGYAYDAIATLADVLERAKSTEADAVVDAIKKTNMPDPVMISAGNVRFDEVGDNAGASCAVIQILKGRAAVVHPKEVAEEKLVFPAPKFWERG